MFRVDLARFRVSAIDARLAIPIRSLSAKGRERRVGLLRFGGRAGRAVRDSLRDQEI